jgi:hypothetical protein
MDDGDDEAVPMAGGRPHPAYASRDKRKRKVRLRRRRQRLCFEGAAATRQGVCALPALRRRHPNTNTHLTHTSTTLHDTAPLPSLTPAQQAREYDDDDYVAGNKGNRALDPRARLAAGAAGGMARSGSDMSLQPGGDPRMHKRLKGHQMGMDASGR